MCFMQASSQAHRDSHLLEQQISFCRTNVEAWPVVGSRDIKKSIYATSLVDLNTRLVIASAVGAPHSRRSRVEEYGASMAVANPGLKSICSTEDLSRLESLRVRRLGVLGQGVVLAE